MSDIKFIKDAVFNSKAAAMAHVTEAMANAVSFGMFENMAQMWDMETIRDNFPSITDTDENGEPAQYASFGPDEEDQPAIDADTSVGQIAVVAIWSDVENSSIPQPAGAPVARLAKLYVLSLPNAEEIIANEKLRPLLNDLLTKQALASARKLAKAHMKDPQAAPMPRDRMAALIAASQSRGGKSAGAAYKALFPVIQAAILKTVNAKVDQLRAAKDFPNARLLAATFAKARLNAQTLEECLSSSEAASFHFPTMPQVQWEALLKFAINWAPRHKANVLTKDDHGATIKDAEGKAVRETVDAPQSPVLFQSWLETRNEATVTQADVPSIDLSDLVS